MWHLFPMHEWALAEAVCQSALEVAEQEHLEHITEINVVIGELQQINQELFKEIITEIIPEQYPQLKKTSINITIEPTTLHCRRCGHNWTFDSMKDDLSAEEAEAIHFVPEVTFVHTRCPSCHQPDFEIIKGRGVSIQTVKGERK